MEPVAQQAFDAVRSIEASEFERRFLRSGHPVVIEGAVDDWRATSHWSLDYLRERVGDCVAPVLAKTAAGVTRQQEMRIERLLDHVSRPQPDADGVTYYLSDARILDCGTPMNAVGEALQPDIADIPCIRPDAYGKHVPVHRARQRYDLSLPPQERGHAGPARGPQDRRDDRPEGHPVPRSSPRRPLQFQPDAVQVPGGAVLPARGRAPGDHDRPRAGPDALHSRALVALRVQPRDARLALDLVPIEVEGLAA